MKKIVYLLVFLALVTLAQALTVPDIWYKFENNGVDDGNLGVNARIGPDCSYLNNESMEGSYSVYCPKTSGGYINISVIDFFNYNGSMCTWSKLYHNSGWTSILLGYFSGGASQGGAIYSAMGGSENKTTIDARNPSEQVHYDFEGNSPYSEWGHYCFTWNGTGAAFYFNSTLTKEGTLSRRSNSLNITAQINSFGSGYGPTGVSNVLFDDWQYWNQTILTPAEITEAYSGFTVADQFSITAVDNATRTPLTTFHAILNTTYVSTTNGTIVTNFYDNNTEAFNIFVWADNYANTSYENYNLSSSLAAELNPGFYILNFSAYSGLFGTVVTTFNTNFSSYNSTDFFEGNTTDGILEINLSAGETFLYWINASGYNKKNGTIDMDGAKSVNISLEDSNMTGMFVCDRVTWNITSINFTVFDEDSNVTLFADIDIVVESVSQYNDRINNSFSFVNNDSVEICIYPEDYNFVSDIYVEYEVPAGRKLRYYIDNANLTNETQYVNLYNFNSTTNNNILEGTILEQNSYQKFPNVLAKLLRFFPSGNEWRLVQMDKSDEFGKIYFYVKERDTLYKVLFEQENSLLYTTSSLKFQCDATTGICDITFPIPTLASTTLSQDLDIWMVYNNATEVITVTWNDPNSITQTVRVEVTKHLPSGIKTLYNQTTSSATGSLSYDTTGQEGTLIVKTYSTASPEGLAFIEYVEKRARQLFEYVSDNVEGGMYEVAFWGFGIILTISGAALWSPFAAAVGLFLGVLITYFIGVFNFLELGFLVVLGIMIVIVAIKVKN